MEKHVLDRIRRLTRLGVRDDIPPHEAKHVVLANSISIVAILLSAIYMVPNSLAPLPMILKLSPLIFAIAYTVPLWLNHRGLHLWAIVWLFAVGAAS